MSQDITFHAGFTRRNKIVRNVKLFSILILFTIMVSCFCSVSSNALPPKIRTIDAFSSHLTPASIPSNTIKGAVKFSDEIYYIPSEKSAKEYMDENMFLVLFTNNYCIRKLKQKK